ncbi:MAG: glycosyl hydrolase-related protein, partial [Jiangellaceae bacterium]
MRYAVVPGAATADAIGAGYAINLPPRHASGAGPVEPLVRLAGQPTGAIVIEAIKLADDRSGDVVVRLYEGLGGRATGHLIPAFPVTAVTETDLLERPIEP